MPKTPQTNESRRVFGWYIYKADYVILSIVCALMLACLAFFIANSAQADLPFVRGKYGSHCYIKGQQPKSITHAIYYPTLDLCLASLGSSQD